MTKAESDRDICFIKAVLLLCKHGHFFYFASHGVICLPGDLVKGKHDYVTDTIFIATFYNL